MHKITSDYHDMRKILTKKFGSQGTNLGSLGPGSQADLGLGPCRFQILVIWGLNEPPAPVVSHGPPENPKSLGAWCDIADAMSLIKIKWPCSKIRQNKFEYFYHIAKQRTESFLLNTICGISVQLCGKY